MQNHNKNKPIKTKKIGVKNMAHIALCSALIATCALITIPLPAIPFTLQTFAIALTLQLLGGKKGTLSVATYILLGTIGLPIFSGFKGGVSALFSMTGGYIIGFFVQALVYTLFEQIFININADKKTYMQIFAHVFGLLVCYIFGTIWFVQIYTVQVATISYSAALMLCVVPFILPDLIKISLAIFIGKRISKHI